MWVWVLVGGIECCVPVGGGVWVWVLVGGGLLWGGGVECWLGVGDGHGVVGVGVGVGEWPIGPPL